MISSLQALRFIFAVFIFAQHFPIRDGEAQPLLDGAGPMGVAFFLILSGFGLSIGYSRKVKSEDFNWWDFMKKRLIRVWPLHILCLLVWIVAAGTNSTFAIKPLPLLGNLFMLQGWIPMIEAKGNDVSWCLSVLVLFYALFPWLSRQTTRHLALGLVIYGIVVAIIGSQLPIVDNREFLLRDWFFYFSAPVRLIDCVVGILAYRLFSKVYQLNISSWWQKLSLTQHTLLELLPIGLFWGAFVFVASHSAPGNHAYPYFIPSVVLICLFTLIQKSGEQRGILALITRPWLVYLGDISFSFYMIHHLVILIINRVFSWVYPGHHWVLRLAITLATSIIGSIVVNKYFEQPITRLLSRSSSR